MTITNVKLSDQGVYVCRSKTGNFTRSGNLTVFGNYFVLIFVATCLLIVIAVEPIVQAEKHVRVKVDESAELSCNISGYPINFIRWRLDGLDEIL